MGSAGVITEARIRALREPLERGGEDGELLAAAVANGGRDAISGVLARAHPSLLAVSLDLDELPAVGLEQLRPGGPVIEASRWAVLVARRLIGGRDRERQSGLSIRLGEHVEEPFRRLGERSGEGVIGPLIGARPSNGRRRHDLAALASDIQAFAEASARVIADLDLLRPFKVVVQPAARGDHHGRLWQVAVDVDEGVESGLTWLAAGHVDIEDEDSRLSPGSASDTEALIEIGPPILKNVSLGAGCVLPSGHGWPFLAWLDRQNSPAVLG